MGCCRNSSSRSVPALPRPQARAEVEDLLDWKPQRPSANLLKRAWQIEDHHGFSSWDSLIAAAAIAQDCTTLLTEDLQQGLTAGDLRIANSFHVNFQLEELSAMTRGKPRA